MGGSRTESKLFVEGTDDLNVITNVVRALRPGLKTVWDRHGERFIDHSNDDQALKRFRDALQSAAGTYGLVLDADADPRKSLQARWRAVRQVLGKVDVETPDSPPSTGWLGQIGPGPARSGMGPRIGVWIMPDNAREGALEAFLEPFVPAGDAAWGYAGRVIHEARVEHAAPFQDKDSRKARMHTWLAWRSEPGRPYGRAIACKDLRPDAGATAQQFVAWFAALFEPASLT